MAKTRGSRDEAETATPTLYGPRARDCRAMYRAAGDLQESRNPPKAGDQQAI